MNFIVSANTDIGIKKSTNQDSLSVKILETPSERIAFAVLCDGMGGLAKGEVASASVVNAFSKWISEDLPVILKNGIKADVIKSQWESLLLIMNDKIMTYGKKQGVNLGTTVAVILIYAGQYYIMNIGDSRIYEISDELIQITQDHSFVAREVMMGKMSPEEAKVHPQRNVLLQCVGASEKIVPDFFTGVIKNNAAYMLCSDGFIHELAPNEILGYLHPSVLIDEKSMEGNTEYLINLNKQRFETDNISAALIRTF